MSVQEGQVWKGMGKVSEGPMCGCRRRDARKGSDSEAKELYLKRTSLMQLSMDLKTKDWVEVSLRGRKEETEDDPHHGLATLILYAAVPRVPSEQLEKLDILLVSCQFPECAKSIRWCIR